MTALEKRMVLHSFMCNQFGCENLREMLDRLAAAFEGLNVNKTTRFSQALASTLKPYSNEVKENDLIRYDENIVAHSQALGMTVEKGKSWKSFQYIALLFTERYLDLYFQDAEILIEKLNEWKWAERASDIADYTMDDLRTLAFQSATGSGKTLLLHANILQYKHYLKENKCLHKLNKIILVTPDEGLSRQHLRELQASNIPAQLFSDNAGSELFAQGGAIVDIIDLHKLAEKKGIKRVALESFEENNLVMVDEGHLGTGGKVWRKFRKQLAKNGFTFEYSATFNQAVSGSGDDIKKLRDEYGKAILFDYSYKFFYGDGYGKDYQISNLQQTDDGAANNLYLLACLLMFYQQCRIFEDKGGQWDAFNIAPPLWVFLGKTVTGGKSAGVKATETDVIRIVNFIAWVQSKRQEVLPGITQLLSGTSGLLDEKGIDIFSQSFSYIQRAKPQQVYDDLLIAIFHAPGQLHIAHLSRSDELQLSAGDANPFGVINVGDASGLYKKLAAIENPLFTLSKNAFSKPLFATVDQINSPVNIIIGARKFAAGWNSWRVSTMGLMHVGTGEGPQIIQMFGRGVRLKGRGMSLKRHSALADAEATDSAQLKRLETLNIFGLKANYMDKFKEYLQKEGIKTDIISFILPTTKQFKDVKGLKILKKQDGVGEFQYATERLDLPAQPSNKDFITLDLYRHLEVLDSHGNKAPRDATDRQRGEITKWHVTLMNMQSVYHKVLEHKRRAQWHNMTISQTTVTTLLENTNWYELYISPEKLNPTEYGKVRTLENLAVDLVCAFANQYWRRQRSYWEHKHIEIAPLDDKNPNYVTQYEILVDEKEEKLIRHITQLSKNVKRGKYDAVFNSGNVTINLLTPSAHAYKPLLYAAAAKSIHITPVPLTKTEAKFVEYVESVVIRQHNLSRNFPYLKGKDIYLMRNMSRGKGVSFFDDYSFYPDFILWIKDSTSQDILFIDPKGLAHYDSKVSSKVDLHIRIKDTEREIRKKNPDIRLHSYIWSHTDANKIGADVKMTREEFHDKGVFFANWDVSEFHELLQHALQ